MSNFTHPAKKSPGAVTIISDDTKESVSAQFNPKELQIDKTVPWSKTNQANKANETGISLEFTGAEGRTMSLELLFDGFEEKKSVAADVELLNSFASVWQPSNPDETKRRPHLCHVTWGGAGGALNKFSCVIESLSIKYTMFSPEGIPLRATCTVKFKEANTVTAKKADKTGGKA